MNCDICEEKGKTVPALYFDSVSALCRNCQCEEEEAAAIRWMEDYYGGGGPVTVTERAQAAAKERAELRRRD